MSRSGGKGSSVRISIDPVVATEAQIPPSEPSKPTPSDRLLGGVGSLVVLGILIFSIYYALRYLL